VVGKHGIGITNTYSGGRSDRRGVKSWFAHPFVSAGFVAAL
jgi:hypothetical protein